MKELRGIGIGTLIVAFAMMFLYMFNLGALAQTSGIPRPCNTTDSTCNLGVSWYYQPASPSPTPVAAATSAYQYSSIGRTTDIANPNVATHIFATFMNGSSGAWQPGLTIFDASTESILGSAIVDATWDTSTSGQTHDFPSLIGGPNGEALISWGAISQASHAGQFGSSNGTATGTTYAAQPVKVILPTAYPSSLPAATTYYIPNAAASSELWSVCKRLGPGTTGYANEISRCFSGGQAQKCKCYQTNGGQIAMGNNQVGWVTHWTGTTGDFYVDTAGTPSPSPAPACSAASLTKCFDPTTQAISQATNAQLQYTSTPGDNDWVAWQLTAVTDSTSGSYAFPTLPSNGEFNAGTQCTISGTTAVGETVLQLANDIVNTYNGSGTIVGSGFSGSAGCTSQKVNYQLYVSTASSGKGTVCSTSSPCMVLHLKGTGVNTTNCPSTYSGFVNNCDITTAGYQLNIPGASTCTSFCTVSATRGFGNTHPTLFGCRLLSLWGQRAVCAWDVDHMTTGFYNTSYAGTTYGDAIMLACFDPAKDYNTANQQLTIGTCNYNGTRTTTTVYAGNHVTTNNPANYVSPGVATGLGASTDCTTVSPYLVPNPSPTPSGFTSFICDWDAAADPNAGSAPYGYPILATLTVTNMPNGNLLLLYGQLISSGTLTLWGSVYDATTGANDNTFQIDSGSTLAAAGDLFRINAITASDGTISVVVLTGSSSAHSCGTVACSILYEASPTNGNAPSFSFVSSISYGGSASAAAPGACHLDQNGGHHLVCAVLSGPFSSSSSNNNVYLKDFYVP